MSSNNSNINNNDNNAAAPSSTNLGRGGRGYSTADRARGGFVGAGHSANRLVPTEPVEAGANALDSTSPAKDMESLSLAAQSATSPPASATSPTRDSASTSPTSRPFLVDLSIPPIEWPTVAEEYREEQHKLFLTYYKNLGFKLSEDGSVFLPRAYNSEADYNGETYLCSRPVQRGTLEDDEYEENFLTYTAPASALPELEKKRKEDLADAKARLAEAHKAPEGPDKAIKIRGIEREVRLLESPLEQFVPSILTEDTRQCESPDDSGSTMHHFGHIPKHMSAVGALGTEEVPRPDGTTITRNRVWKEGEIWRPNSTSKDWEAWAGEDETSTSTFHGFYPRHPRPDGIGLGHLGYDSVYTRSRDGLGYTSQDVPHQDWDQAVNKPIVFEFESGERFIVDEILDEDNPCLRNITKPKPLSEILAEEEARDAADDQH